MHARVNDAVAEVKRQLGPLERKAKRALAYKDVSSELADLTLRLAVDDLRVLQVQYEECNALERDLIAKRIYEELELGIVKESTLKEFTDIIERMHAEDGIEAVVLGCTELPLLLNEENCPVGCLDSVEIHLNKLIEFAMQ